MCKNISGYHPNPLDALERLFFALFGLTTVTDLKMSEHIEDWKVFSRAFFELVPEIGAAMFVRNRSCSKKNLSMKTKTRFSSKSLVGCTHVAQFELSIEHS